MTNTFEQLCPMMASAGISESQAMEAVTVEQPSSQEQIVELPALTAEQIQECLKYFKWVGATSFPNDQAEYTCWNFEELSAKVNASPEQIKQLYEEFLVYKNSQTIQGNNQ